VNLSPLLVLSSSMGELVEWRVLVLRREVEPEVEPTAFLSLPNAFFIVKNPNHGNTKASKPKATKAKIFLFLFWTEEQRQVQTRNQREQELYGGSGGVKWKENVNGVKGAFPRPPIYSRRGTAGGEHLPTVK
jgi:hypothetical protein